ncbi:MAG: hypothetical protein LBH85_04420, partial [Treponema sp.]|nr:hypothetical protein [Treponema sp.]
IRRRGSRERHECALCLEVEGVGHARAKREARRSAAETQLGLGQWARRETLSREDADAGIHEFDAVSRRKTDWLR